MNFEETTLELNETEFIQNEEETFGFIETQDSFMLDVTESEFELELREESKENGEERWVPDAQFRLLYTYLKDMAREPLLTPKEEIEIAAKIKKCEARERGIKAVLDRLSKKIDIRNKRNGHQNVRSKELLKRIERLNSLLKAYSERTKELKERFIKANLRLVVSIANRFRDRGLPLLDLIQEGNIGLMRAVRRFDHTKGYKFSTYAIWWIKQYMSRALMEKTKTIKVPAYVLEQSNKVYRISSMLHKEMEEIPMPEEIAEEGGMSVEVVKQILETKNGSVIHLDSPINDGEITSGLEKVTRLELVSDKGSPAPDSLMAETALKNRIKEALSLLNPREEEIIRMRFEIGHKTRYTLDDIGKKFNLTRERVRQIEKGALKKLGKSEMRETLRGFLE